MTRSTDGLARIVTAGLLGGLAEVACVTLLRGPGAAAEVARQVAEAVAQGAGASPHALGWGLAIHMVLSAAVGLGYGFLVWKPFTRRLGPATVLGSACAALASLWVLNFLVLLPAVHPAFLDLMPYPASLASKLLFGMAMAAYLAGGHLPATGAWQPALIQSGRSRRI